MLSVTELRELSVTRLREATVLFIAKEYSGAAYLCGYAVELTLKSKICMVLNWAGFPETRSEFETAIFQNPRLKGIGAPCRFKRHIGNQIRSSLV